MRILIATKKPFAKEAINQINRIAKDKNYNCDILEKYASKEELKNAVSNVDALVVRSDVISSGIIKDTNNLKIIVRAGAGYDNIDLEAATQKNICVMNTPGQNANAVAELVIGMMLYQARGQFNGKPGTELLGKTLGIHAFGNVGQRVAEIAHGFHMNIMAFDPFLPKDFDKKQFQYVEFVSNVDDLYKNSRYISLHIPANEHTIKSINYDLLIQMPKNATLINTARKEVIHESDLIRVMKERQDFTYLSDMIPDSADTFEKDFMGRYFFTPKKMGAQTAEANINAGVAAVKQIIAFFETGDTTFKVN